MVNLSNVTDLEMNESICNRSVVIHSKIDCTGDQS